MKVFSTKARALVRALKIVLLTILPTSLAVSTALAQDSVIVIDPDAPVSDSTEQGALPPEILSELLEDYNDSLSIRLPGGITVPRGSMLGGKIAAFRGSVHVAGTIEGSLTVINGDLVVDSGGVIHGDVLVAGGGMTVAPGGVHDGEARVYWDAAPVYREADGTLALRERRRSVGELATAQRTFATGKVKIERPTVTVIKEAFSIYLLISGVTMMPSDAPWTIASRRISGLLSLLRAIV